MRAVERRTSGWGGVTREPCRVYRPERLSELVALVRRGGAETLVSRGLGRSYGDASLNRGAGVIDHIRMNRFLGFDPVTSTIECEAGVTIGEVVDAFLPRGLFPRVTPGTRQVTVGGAIACDVHGKNHHVEGTFGASVEEIDLLIASGEVVRCSPQSDPELFWATIGGMGLTGAIVSARFRLDAVESGFVKLDRERVGDLHEALGRLAQTDRDYRYSVAWIDCLSRGRSLGRSVLLQANVATRSEVGVARSTGPPHTRSGRPRAVVPFNLPGWVLNRWSVRGFNALYYARNGDREGELVEFDRYFYPLDAIRSWNRLYGRRGFIQYQVALPLAGAEAGIAVLVERLARSGRGSFLGVLKRFGAANPGYLSFPFDGYTLALDLPNAAGLESFVRELDEVTLRFGGRVYLAKDAMLDPERFARMYPRSEEFRRVKRRVDPECRFGSSLSRRLGLT